MAYEFKLPELGENIEAGDVVRVLVKVGDAVSEGDTLFELETDKAVVEVPADKGGTVTEVRVKEGEKASVGQVLLGLDSSGAEADAPAQEEPSAALENDSVGESGEDTREAELSAAPAEEPQPAPKADAAPPASPGPSGEAEEGQRLAAPAAPSVRKEARELGVRIADVAGSGPRGRITISDVRSHVRNLNRAHAPGSQAAQGAMPGGLSLPDLSRFGGIRREAMSNVRRATARHMAATWNTVPQVTQYDKADVGALETLRKQLAPEMPNGRLTMTAILLKVAAAALRRFPEFNASVDMQSEEIVYKDYVHVGVAVDTPRGLLVPVIRDVDRKGIAELAESLDELSARARERKTGPEELQGGCFTISNLGGIGGTAFSPIVNFPEVAILGVSRAERVAVPVGEGFEARLQMPLSLSYDHRLIDGAAAARFLRWICRALEQPLLLSL